MMTQKSVERQEWQARTGAQEALGKGRMRTLAFVTRCDKIALSHLKTGMEVVQ